MSLSLKTGIFPTKNDLHSSVKITLDNGESIEVFVDHDILFVDLIQFHINRDATSLGVARLLAEHFDTESARDCYLGNLDRAVLKLLTVGVRHYAEILTVDSVESLESLRSSWHKALATGIRPTIRVFHPTPHQQQFLAIGQKLMAKLCLSNDDSLVLDLGTVADIQPLD